MVFLIKHSHVNWLWLACPWESFWTEDRLHSNLITAMLTPQSFSYGETTAKSMEPLASVSTRPLWQHSRRGAYCLADLAGGRFTPQTSCTLTFNRGHFFVSLQRPTPFIVLTKAVVKCSQNPLPEEKLRKTTSRLELVASCRCYRKQEQPEWNCVFTSAKRRPAETILIELLDSGESLYQSD